MCVSVCVCVCFGMFCFVDFFFFLVNRATVEGLILMFEK